MISMTQPTDTGSRDPEQDCWEAVRGGATVRPGAYFFRCDIHPLLMTGTFIVA